MKTSRSIPVHVPVLSFLRNAYFSPYDVCIAAQRIQRDYDVYKDLYIHSVEIYNSNGGSYFSINFSSHYNTPIISTLFVIKGCPSLSDYDFRCLRNYFKHLSSTHGNK